MNDFILFGAGGHAKVIFDILLSLKNNVICFFDNDESIKSFLEKDVFSYDSKHKENSKLIISIGDNYNRKKVSDFVTHKFGKAIHPSAIISPNSDICEGSVIMHSSIIQTGSNIAKHCIINTSASVDHDCKIDDFVHISPNATLCGNVKIGEGSHIGAGAIIIQSVNIGKWVTIGAGSVVINDVPDYAVVVGNPGKIIKYNK